MRDYDRLARQAVERLDVLEDELPRGTCQVRGCSRGEPQYEMAGAFGVFYVCSRHRPVYRDHLRIVQRIRDL